jgi:hypothetical protein
MTSHDWQNATPEQRNAWKTITGLIAYTTITSLFYEGNVGGSEFLTYNAGKVYFALDATFGSDNTPNVFPASVALFNLANAQFLLLSNECMSWDVTAAAYKHIALDIKEKCFWFSRIIGYQYTTMKFNGYRLNV